MKFSLIIPLGPGRNAEILDSIKSLDYPKKEFEIIVEKGKNPSENRNKGIKKARGKFLVFLDDDAYLEEDYLKNIEEFFKKNNEVDIVGGPQLSPKKGENFFARISGAVLTSNFGAFRVNKRYLQKKEIYEAGETDLTSANLCAKKNIFENIGGFDESLYPGEDPEFINRAKKKNLKVYYNPCMVIYHKRRPNLTSYIKQIFNYGLTRPKVNKFYKDKKFFFLIPMIFTVYCFLIPILSWIIPLFIFPLLLYILLAIVFGLFDSFKNELFLGIILLPFLYFITHISYGLGMIKGYLER